MAPLISLALLAALAWGQPTEPNGTSQTAAETESQANSGAATAGQVNSGAASEVKTSGPGTPVATSGVNSAIALTLGAVNPYVGAAAAVALPHVQAPDIKADPSVSPAAAVQETLASPEVPTLSEVAGAQGTEGALVANLISPIPAAPPPYNPQKVAEVQAQEGGLLSSQGSLPPRAVLTLSSSYIKAGSPQDAVRLTSTVLAANPNDAKALSLRAQARAIAGDADGSYADAKRAVELDPNDAIARVIAGHRDQIAAAAEKFKKVRTDDLGQTIYKDGAGTSGAAVAAVGFGTANAATVRSYVGFTAPPLPTVALAHFNQARDRLAVGDLTGALLDANAAVDAAADKAAPLILRAYIDNSLRNPTAAVEDAGKALRLEPRNAAALREQAFAELALGQASKACADADQAVLLEPTNGTGYLYRAMAEEKLGMTAQAVADYSRAERLSASLTPLVEEALRRLGASPPAPTRGLPVQRSLLRGGAVVLSLLLILLGISGTSAGRRAVTTARARLGGRAAAPEAGALLAGNYRIVRELGRGGMGVVYEAVDETLERPVAVKRLQREAGLGAEDIEGLLREARLVAKLKHPRIAEIYNVLADGDLYLVFEYVDGQPLDRALSERVRFSGADALRIIGDVAAGVGYAHGQRIIHRDLKPSNVMLEGSGAAKVMDFGIAHQSTKATNLTLTAASGTPPYMAPEQLMGSVSKASDLYALAVMSYELLAGKRPFDGPDFLEQKLRREFQPPSALGLRPELDGFFAAALDPDPTRRPATAEDFVSGLKRALC